MSDDGTFTMDSTQRRNMKAWARLFGTKWKAPRHSDNPERPCRRCGTPTRHPKGYCSAECFQNLTER